jgi:hypothetical protein
VPRALGAIACFGHGERLLDHAGERMRAVVPAERSDLDLGGGQFSARVAGVHRASRLDQQHVRLLLGLGAVLDATRDDEQLAPFELYVAVAKLDCQATAEDQEEVVCVVVPMRRTRP